MRWWRHDPWQIGDIGNRDASAGTGKWNEWFGQWRRWKWIRYNDKRRDRCTHLKNSQHTSQWKSVQFGMRLTLSSKNVF